MLLFVSIVLLSLVMSVACLALMSAAAESKREPTGRAPEITAQPGRFFVGDGVAAADPRAIPVEILLSQIERHVRLEQMAAERFVSIPTIESLQARSDSSFVN